MRAKNTMLGIIMIQITVLVLRIWCDFHSCAGRAIDGSRALLVSASGTRARLSHGTRYNTFHRGSRRRGAYKARGTSSDLGRTQRSATSTNDPLELGHLLDKFFIIFLPSMSFGDMAAQPCSTARLFSTGWFTQSASKDVGKRRSGANIREKPGWLNGFDGSLAASSLTIRGLLLGRGPTNPRTRTRDRDTLVAATGTGTLAPS